MEYTCFILTTLIYFGFCEECVIKKPPGSYLEKELVDELELEYPIDQQPCTNNTNHVEVEVSYVNDGFFFDADEEILTLFIWNVFEWEDSNLKWDIDKYKGLKIAHLNNLIIFSPMMNVINSADPDPELMVLADCVVKHTGHVMYAQTVEHSILCSSTLKNWPYDTKHCTLKFDGKTWFDDIEDSKILFTKIDMYLEDSTNSAGWTIVKAIETRNLTGEHQATIELILERKAECLEASIVIPAFIVSVLTVTSVFLNIKDNVRLGILCLSLLSHFVFCNEISENIPRHGADTPVILYFVSHSTMLTVFLFVLTFFLQSWSKLKTPPFRIVVFLNNLVFKTHGKHFVIPRWNDEVLDRNYVDSLSDSTEWLNFCNIVNSVSLIVSVITYIILFSLYMPHFTPDTHVTEIH